MTYEIPYRGSSIIYCLKYDVLLKHTQGNAGMSPYSASKAGVIGMVKSAGKEYATTGKISVTNIRTILLVILVAIKFQIFWLLHFRINIFKNKLT